MSLNQEEKQHRIEQLTPGLLNWYGKTARYLPWRENPSAYRVWVSEIMLQQTRIEAVKPYYSRFLEHFPNVQALAEAPEEQVLKCWEGLGYYSRARNLKKAAMMCMELYEGHLPASYEQLKELPGIGNYTAGAIASIACGIPAPAVDGNVLRVFSRVFADEQDISKQSVKKELEDILFRAIPREAPGAFNEAIMEIGETICIPNGKPLCPICPLADFCQANKEDSQEQYPVKAQKKPRKIEEKTILLLQVPGKIALRKRPDTGLLAGLYEFPGFSGKLSAEEVQQQMGCKNKPKNVGKAKHIFSHVEWHMVGYCIMEDEELPGDWIYVSKEEMMEKYPIPNAFRAYIRQLL